MPLHARSIYMSGISNNVSSNTDFNNMYLNLKPPGSESGTHSNITLNPSGDHTKGTSALMTQLGYSQKDTIGKAVNEVIDLASQLNIAIMANLTGDAAIIAYLGNIDPTVPSLQPIKSLLAICEQSLMKGKIGGNVISNSAALEENGAISGDVSELIAEAKNSLQPLGQSSDQKVQNARNSQSGGDEDDTDAATKDGRTKTTVNQSGNTQSSTSKTNTSQTSNSMATQDGDSDQNTGSQNQGLPEINYHTPDQNTGYGLGVAQENFNNNLQTEDNISNDIKSGIDQGRTIVVNDTPNTQVTLGKTSGGNPWLAGNVFVAFLMSYMQMQRVLMESKVVEGNIQLAAMNLVVTLAQTTADIIMDIAKTNQMIHIVTAVMSGVAICASGLGLGFGILHKSPNAMDTGNVIGGLGSSFEKMATASTQAATDLTIAQQEGLKEMLQAYRQLASNQMDKASEAFKANEDQIAQNLSALEKIEEGLQNALAASLRK